MQSSPHHRALVVSIHDVSPLTWEPVRDMMAELDEAGVGQCSLLVVPDHHRRGHFLEHREFCDWLTTAHHDGHEVITHGYYHRRERRPGENLWQKLMTRTYTADEGEFYDIGEEEALALVTRAQQEFASLGLHPRGFIAPAWLLSDEGERALQKASIAYTTRLRHVLSLANGELHESQSMVYSVRSRLRRAVSLAWNASLYDRLRGNPLLRVSLHPPDITHKKIWRQILKYIALAVQDRKPMTYWHWVSNHPPFQPRPNHDHNHVQD